MCAIMTNAAASVRRRNISWESAIDSIAEELAFEKRLKGGVSELLARLVMAERSRKRGIAHLHPKRPTLVRE